MLPHLFLFFFCSFKYYIAHTKICQLFTLLATCIAALLRCHWRCLIANFECPPSTCLQQQAAGNLRLHYAMTLAKGTDPVFVWNTYTYVNVANAVARSVVWTSSVVVVAIAVANANFLDASSSQQLAMRCYYYFCY